MTTTGRDVIDTNLTGVFYCTRAALPEIKKAGGGWIINIASLAGRNYFAERLGLLRVQGGPDCLRRVADAGSAARQHPRHRHHAGLSGDRVLAPIARDDDSWKLSADDVAEAVMGLFRHPARSLPSRIEIRPSRPK